MLDGATIAQCAMREWKGCDCTRICKVHAPRTFKVIVAGSRTFDNYPMLQDKLDSILSARKDEVEIISGGAKGADALGERYAKEKGLRLTVMRADWEKHGKKAGLLRNHDMAVYGDALVAFWDGKSRGTANMIELAKAGGLKTRVIKFKLQ